MTTQSQVDDVHGVCISVKFPSRSSTPDPFLSASKGFNYTALGLFITRRPQKKRAFGFTMANQVYAVYNHKGGVGKTSTCFKLAVDYAELYTDSINVLAIDMCPQADLSKKLMGDCAWRSARSTVANYLVDSLHAQTKLDPYEYCVYPHDSNPAIPKNLRLVCGHPELEDVARLIDFRRYITPIYEQDYWTYHTCLLKNMVDDITAKNGPWLVVIDTSSPLSVYTEMALVAAGRLIIPTVPNKSAEGVLDVIECVYGKRDYPPKAVLKRFSDVVCEKQIKLPPIHMFITDGLHNVDELMSLYKSNSNLFTEKGIPVSSTEAQDFARAYCSDIDQLAQILLP